MEHVLDYALHRAVLPVRVVVGEVARQDAQVVPTGVQDALVTAEATAPMHAHRLVQQAVGQGAQAVLAIAHQTVQTHALALAHLAQTVALDYALDAKYNVIIHACLLVGVAVTVLEIVRRGA